MEIENNTPRKVIGIGETVLDIIFKDNQTIGAVPGGSVFNAMVSLGRCGAHAMLLSEVGDDQAGAYVTDFMADNGVDNSHMLKVNGMKTPVSLAFLNERNDASYSFYKSEPVSLPDMTLPEVNADDIVLAGSYYAVSQHERQRVKAFLEHAKSQGAIIYYDVNYRPAHQDELVKLMPNIIENLELADIVRGSREDFDIIYKTGDAEKIYRSQISFYTHNFIYTDSSNPVRVFGEGGIEATCPTEKIDTVSTIGAGDNFNAGFIFGLLKAGITRERLEEGLTAAEWDTLTTTAQAFSADCCKSIYNYVSKEFGGRQ